MAIRFVYFDCMDTLIQMDIPSMDVYSSWAYAGAGELGLWQDGLAFDAAWKEHRERLAAHGDLREGTILGRIQDLLEERIKGAAERWPRERIQAEAARIHERYWRLYSSASFVLPGVEEALEGLRRRGLRLGVLSNFMVEGGIPALLAAHGLERHFEVVLVSCDHGYRKPSKLLYAEAIRSAGMDPAEMLHVGDNPVADYEGARSAGIRSLLYDPRGAHPAIADRVRSLGEVEAWIEREGV